MCQEMIDIRIDLVRARPSLGIDAQYCLEARVNVEEVG